MLFILSLSVLAKIPECTILSEMFTLALEYIPIQYELLHGAIAQRLSVRVPSRALLARLTVQSSVMHVIC